MCRQRLLQCYHIYALAIGVTSYRLDAGRFRQTWLTRCYTLALNTVQLLLLFPILWMTSQYIETIDWFPNILALPRYVFYAVSSVAIIYSIISRGCRDTALIEVERIVARFKQRERRCLGQTESDYQNLGYLFYLKFGTMCYLCVSSWLAFLLMPVEISWCALLCSVYLGQAFNIPIVAANRYFLILWEIACCFRYINCRLAHLIRLKQTCLPTIYELNELHRLWLLHSVLRRCVLKMRKIYGFLMLTCRFYFVTFAVVNGYWGLLFWLDTDTPPSLLIYGAIGYMVRFLNFYLFDVMCELAVQHQNSEHHTVSEGPWFKELNAFLLYASTSKMSLSVCHLYTVDRKCWFQMLGFIISTLIVLLQFHLFMKNKDLL